MTELLSEPEVLHPAGTGRFSSTKTTLGTDPSPVRETVCDELEAMTRAAFAIDEAKITGAGTGAFPERETTYRSPVGFFAEVPLIGADGSRIGMLRLTHSTPRADLAGSGRKSIERFARLLTGVITKTAALRGGQPEAKDRKVSTQTGDDAGQELLRDALTGLPNREALLLKLQERIDTQPAHPRHYALLFVDVDFFKRINDSLGHLVADALLIEVGRRIEETVGELSNCTVARLGGDEFAILLGDVEAREDAMTYAAMLEFLLRQSISCSQEEVFISASVGIAFGGTGVYSDAAQMLEDSDVAMSRAKHLGKAQCVVFSEKMREAAKARLRLESDLREALRENHFELHYQPKVWLENGLVKGFEALLRWRHKDRGPVSPAEFIPVAEDTGLITHIGRWVTATAIRQMARWRNDGVVPLNATMAVNLSASQFHEPDLLDSILADLKTWGLPAENLVLEVTEGLLVENSKSALTLLQAIVQTGIGLDLDDFGTGYSSLSYLHRFPFRSLKIDRSFIARMSTEPQSESLVHTIVGLAQSMQMDVIAEGVETEVQAAALRRMGCDVAQGYLYSPARSAAELEGLLERSGGFLEPKPVVQAPKPAPLSGERMKATSGIHYLTALRFRGVAIGCQKGH